MIYLTEGLLIFVVFVSLQFHDCIGISSKLDFGDSNPSLISTNPGGINVKVFNNKHQVRKNEHPQQQTKEGVGCGKNGCNITTSGVSTDDATVVLLVETSVAVKSAETTTEEIPDIPVVTGTAKQRPQGSPAFTSRGYESDYRTGNDVKTPYQTDELYYFGGDNNNWSPFTGQPTGRAYGDTSYQDLNRPWSGYEGNNPSQYPGVKTHGAGTPSTFGGSTFTDERTSRTYGGSVSNRQGTAPSYGSNDGYFTGRGQDTSPSYGSSAAALTGQGAGPSYGANLDSGSWRASQWRPSPGHNNNNNRPSSTVGLSPVARTCYCIGEGNAIGAPFVHSTAKPLGSRTLKSPPHIDDKLMPLT